MKHILLFSTTLLMAATGYSQNGVVSVASQSPATPVNANTNIENGIINYGVANKTTGLTDTLFFGSNAQFNGPFSNLYFDFALPADSGRLYGTNVTGSKGYGQLYRYVSIDNTAPGDTTYNILGVISRFSGTVQTSSTKNVVFSVWKRDAAKYAVTGRTKFFIFGVPLAATLATKQVAFTALNVAGMANTAYFASPITGINYDVYVGYTVAYQWAGLGGDSIGLTSTTVAGQDTYTIEAGTGDTLVNARNMIQQAAGAWKSTVFDLGIGNGGDQVIMPIIQLSCPSCSLTSSVKGYTNNNLTFLGNYPNPATSSTNIKFFLKNNADVKVEIIDAAGRTINTISKTGLGNGQHVINVETSSLAAGNYVYIIQTSDGSHVASQLTVTK